jgi:hypothetical protein
MSRPSAARISVQFCFSSSRFPRAISASVKSSGGSSGRVEVVASQPFAFAGRYHGGRGQRPLRLNSTAEPSHPFRVCESIENYLLANGRQVKRIQIINGLKPQLLEPALRGEHVGTIIRKDDAS